MHKVKYEETEFQAPCVSFLSIWPKFVSSVGNLESIRPFGQKKSAMVIGKNRKTWFGHPFVKALVARHEMAPL